MSSFDTCTQRWLSGSSSISSINRRLCSSASAALVERDAAATDLLDEGVAQLLQFAQGQQPRARAQRASPGSRSRPLRGQAEQKRPTDSSSKRRTWSSSVRRAARSSGLVRGAAGAKR